MNNEGKYIIEFGSASTVYPTLVDSLRRLNRDFDISLVLVDEDVYRALYEDLNSRPAYQSQHKNNYKGDSPLQVMEWEIMSSRQVPRYQGLVFTYPRKIKAVAEFPMTPEECIAPKGKKKLMFKKPKRSEL